MADVWLGLTRPPVGPAGLVVIKRILRERVSDQRFVELFVQEGRLSTQLDHPNVVRTLEAGFAQGQYYLALEYLRGQTVLAALSRAAESRRFLPIPYILGVARDIAAGLAYAHEARDRFGNPIGLVHRDISPSNLFVGYDGIAKVLDFGIARADTASGRAPVKGKLPYVSPEQARAEPVDGRSDLFAFGVVLHEMLTLRPLFRGTNDIDTIRRVVDGKVPRPSSLRAGCAPALDELVLGLLERAPERRPQGARDLMERIDATARQLGLTLSGSDAGATMRSLFAKEHAESLTVSAASIAADIERGVPPGRPRRRFGARRPSEITPVPA